MHRFVLFFLAAFIFSNHPLIFLHMATKRSILTTCIATVEHLKKLTKTKRMSETEMKCDDPVVCDLLATNSLTATPLGTTDHIVACVPLLDSV